VITSGTPGFPCALDYGGFTGAHFVHRVSPGTLVYCDLTSLSQLPASLGYAPAAFVASRVVSRPSDSVITCDAGHKTLSVDRGVPNCEVVGYPDMIPLTPSEEHLPLDVSKCRIVPQIGEILYLLPQHVCPTVNNFDYSIVIKGERSRIELVLARGHEAPWTETKFTKC
jgi:D-serine deaminase-like pyridoxal phosphate-dependent protein